MGKLISFFMELFYVVVHKIHSSHLICDGYFYYTKVDHYGPYCKECWDLDRKREIGRVKKKNGKDNKYICTSCNITINTNDHVVSKLQKTNKQ